MSEVYFFTCTVCFFLILGGGVPVKGQFLLVQVILVLFSGFAAYSGGSLRLFSVFVFCDLVSIGVLGFRCCFIQHV